MMDYEKKYKEALELAKSYYGKGHNEFLDSMFPELAESEDEKTRKGLIKLLTVASDAYLVESTGIKKDAYLAWLEKQKEQKPAEWNANDKAFIKDCARILDDNRYPASAERLLSMFPIRPAEWSEEDEIRRESCMLYLANARDLIEFSQYIGDKARESGKKEIQKDIDWLKSLRPQPSWKPSEEDEK